MIPLKLNIFPAMTAAILALLALPGCFTGIEGTAKIKDRDSGKNNRSLSAEEKLLRPIHPHSPKEWQNGKSFIITSGRHELAFSPASVASTLHPGDTLYFQSLSTTIRITGDTVTDVIFQNKIGQKLMYQTEMPINRVLIAEKLDIPFTIDASVVESAQRILRGRELWPLRPGTNGMRYNRVTVEDVIPGNSEYPLFVIISTGDTVKMVIDGHKSTSRVFSNLFSLSDPKMKYPQISDENWEMICRGKITEGMSREECKLAIGTPASVERITAYNGLIEHWSYENGVYLNFLDGILTSFRE